MNSIKKMGGAKDIVRLENVEFERYFEVYSDNQIEARKKITVEFMEKIRKSTILYLHGLLCIIYCVYLRQQIIIGGHDSV